MFIPIQIAAVIAIAHSSPEPLPLKQANSVAAREAAAIHVIQSLNRAQQAFYVEHRRFAPDLRSTLTGWPASSESYRYQVRGTNRIGIQLAEPRAMNLRSVSGAVMPDAQGRPITIVCRSLASGPPARAPIAQNGRLTCAAGTEPVR